MCGTVPKRVRRVVSAEPFIPWELVQLKEPPGADGIPKPLPDKTYFLAQMGLIRWLHNRGPAPLKLRIRKGRAYYVVPEYPVEDALPQAQQEIPLLKKLLAPRN
jgi:hypothetical protein